jgi:hypothetical protein
MHGVKHLARSMLRLRFYRSQAFLWKMLAVQPQSVLQAKQWIQRIVVGTIGVEMAGTLVHVLTGTVPGH